MLASNPMRLRTMATSTQTGTAIRIFTALSPLIVFGPLPRPKVNPVRRVSVGTGASLPTTVAATNREFVLPVPALLVMLSACGSPRQ